MSSYYSVFKKAVLRFKSNQIRRRNGPAESWHTAGRLNHSPLSIWQCYHAQPTPCWSETNLPTPLCRILGIAAHRDAVMCHLALGPVGQELSLTSPLKLVCHWKPSRESLRGPLACIPPMMRTDQRVIADTYWGNFACPFLSIGSWIRLAPSTIQLQIKDCPFGPQPTDHSVPLAP